MRHTVARCDYQRKLLKMPAPDRLRDRPQAGLECGLPWPWPRLSITGLSLNGLRAAGAEPGRKPCYAAYGPNRAGPVALPLVQPPAGLIPGSPSPDPSTDLSLRSDRTSTMAENGHNQPSQLNVRSPLHVGDAGARKGPDVTTTRDVSELPAPDPGAGTR
jgi:hypothetical protein